MKSNRVALVSAAINTIKPYAVYDGEGAESGEGGNVDPAGDPAIQALIQSAVAEATKGLTSNRDELLNEKKELKSQFESMKKQWGNLDPEMVKNLVSRFENDEETKLIAEGKFDAVFERRNSAMRKDYENKLEASTGKLTEFEQLLGSKDSLIKQLKVEGAIRQSAADLGLVPSAFDDAISRATSIFSIDEDGELAARDADGVVQISRNGKDKLPVSEWLENMKENAPHWFPSPEGAGAGGGKGGGKGGAYSITRAESLDPTKYRAAKDRAEKAGQTLQIIES
jgi:hypothetical protein